jgi:hypothetical protein
MRYLIDTVVLLRLFDRADAQHANVRDALRQLRKQGCEGWCRRDRRAPSLGRSASERWSAWGTGWATPRATL